MSAKRPSIWRDESGSITVEMAVVVLVFFLVLGGIVDGSYLFYQWNAATKAVQVRARLAAVSEPVAPGLKTLTGLSGSVLPGDQMPPFNCTCDGGTGACTSSAGTACGAYSVDAMNTLVYGRAVNGTGKTACATPDPTRNGRDIGMCNYFSNIARANVVVKYEGTGLGYAGRPGGPVPTITVRLKGLTFNYVFLQSLIGKAPVALPGLVTSVTGEDLRKSGS